ncbi:MAG: 3-isopropylmalate dehydratase large subunit [Chloroflexi bacterium RBG_16_48_8]|nr:MAG: 3-isopropylmalate dehydratase large subunit [Chloroflexi bacterium RBG_16_48_8]
MNHRTHFDKVWEDHVVFQEPDYPAILYIDLHLIHEVTSPQAFDGLRPKGLRVRRPDKSLATMDHSTPTLPLNQVVMDPQAEFQLKQLELNCQEFGIPLFQLGSENRGIVHVISPELGMTQPGMTIVCGDSHTSTHGAFGALAFGIGTSEVEHVLATQCLLQHKPQSMEIRIEGKLDPGVTAKDIILALIARIGINGGVGYAVEYTGEAIRSLDMEGRMTVCNMSIEAGARAGMIAPDDTTFEYLADREYTPKGEDWERALSRWRQLGSEECATYDRSITMDVSNLEPMITFGTNPGMGIMISEAIPNPDHVKDPERKAALIKALRYMDLKPGKPLLGHKVDVVFLGSCTNSRITDLRMATSLLDGRKVSEKVRVLVVPGSEEIKKMAEAEGLHQRFIQAGAEWREPGCSMCIGMNGDQLEPGQYAVSTSNRNFEGRQGKGGRTFLASPLTAIASAITGQIMDPRTLM